MIFYYIYIIKITCQLETEIINIVEIIKKNKQMREVKSFIDLMKSFYGEKSCREFLEDIKWHGEPICPHCNCQTKVWGIERSGFFNGREKWAKGFENQRV